MSESPLKVWLDREGKLLRLRLARPKANVLDAPMIAALDAAFTAHTHSAGVVAALIDHEGPHFCFGASVEEHLPEHCARMLASFHALLIRMLGWPRPILVAARGQCLGGGLELACAGSLLFAAPDAHFGQPESKLAVFAPAGSVLLAPRIGQARAEDLLLSGRSVDAATAHAWGLVNMLSDDPQAAALSYFDKELAPKSASSLGYALRAARGAYATQARERLTELEKLYLEGLMKTRDAAEGLNAFLAKRTAKWENR